MRALVAAAPGERPPAGFSRLFPDEMDSSAALSPADARRLTHEPSPLYAAASAGVAGALSRRLGIPPAAAADAARDPLVWITHAFLDRLLRLKRLVDRDGRAAWAVPRGALETPVLGASLIPAASSSRAFNQALLGRAADVWRLADVAAPAAPAAAARAAANLNFAAPGGLRRRLAWKAARLSSRVAGRVPALGLAYAEPCFLDAGLIGPLGLADLQGPEDDDAPAPDGRLRREVACGAAAARPALDALLASWSFDAGEREAAARVHAELCAALFPRARLEGLPRRLDRAQKTLARFAPRPLLLSETGGERASFLIAAARSLRMPVIGVQHGAHYGFVDAPCHVELEYPHFDRFVTWGWRRMPDHPLCRGTEAVPLPSPWMSERAKRWRAGGAPGPRRRDVLLMTERLSPFPPPLTTVRLNRQDALGALDAELAGLVRALNGRGLSVLHKPFNAASAAAQDAAIASLLASQGGRYEVHDRLDKGLTPELLASCAAVVWDEPGGGVFECLVSGIPTLLLWTRSQYDVAPRAAAPFRALEEAGIAHRAPDSLAESAAALAADPAGWVRDPRRAELVAEACRELAWADDDWARPWRRFLDSLQ